MKLEQETDTLNARVIVWTALLTSLATALGVLFAWWLRDTTFEALRAPEVLGAKRGEPAPSEVNGIETAPFPNITSQAPPSSRLHQYGWSDRERRLVHIPIARAKALYLTRRATPGRPSAP